MESTTKIPNKRIFNVIDLTKAVTQAKKEPKKVAKVTTKYKEKKNDADVVQTIGDREILATQDSSIQQFLNHCHPDIQTFVRTNEIKTATAKAGHLIVITKNDLRVSIKTVAANKSEVLIQNKKKVILFKGITTVKMVKEVKNVTN